MPRALTLTVGEVLAAATHLQTLKRSGEAPPPGAKRPPFNAELRVASAFRALMPAVMTAQRREAELQDQWALRENDEAIARDPNGNILDGRFRVRDVPKFNLALGEMRQETVTVDIGDLSIDDVLDMGGRVGPDALAALLPLLTTTEPSPEALARLDAWETAVDTAAAAPPGSAAGA